MKKTKKSINFDEALKALLDNSKPFAPIYLYELSALEPANLSKLKHIWSEINVDRRISLVEDLEELGESDPLLNFDEIGLFGLNDKDARVRAGAIRLLWEYEEKKLISPLTKLLKNDDSELVRANAASALGKFVYLGDMEEIPEKEFNQVVDDLLQVLNSEDKPLVRRRALEALSFYNRDDILNHLENAFKSGSSEWISTALFGMGRSANERWENYVLQKLETDDTENKFEAVRAAGELELKNARLPILSMLDDDDLDDDIRYAAIWSLSQIGGENVEEKLQDMLEKTEDDDEADFISNALDNLEFTQSLGLPGLFDVDEFSDDEIDEIVNLSEDEDDNDDDKKEQRLSLN